MITPKSQLNKTVCKTIFIGPEGPKASHIDVTVSPGRAWLNRDQAMTKFHQLRKNFCRRSFKKG